MENVKKLVLAADECWNAILQKNIEKLAHAFLKSFNAHVILFPSMVDDDINSIIESYENSSIAWKLSGAGGGGYLILISENLNEKSNKN